MKIAMVSEHASPLAALGGVDAGGQNVHVAALSGALADLGHSVTVYTRRDDSSLPETAAMRPGVDVVHVTAGPPSPIAKDDIFPHVGDLADGLRDHWSRRRPDVVHAHFWMSGLAALQAAERLDLPVVQTFHALGSVKRRHQGQRDTSPATRIECEVAITRRADRIIATCSDEVFELSRLGADVARISVVPCGVDTDLFRPMVDQAPGTVARRQARHRLVSVGRLVERKGVDDAIRALADLPETELVVAGGPAPSDLGTDPDVRRLARLAETLGVRHRVLFTGRLDRPQVADLLTSADLVVCVPWYEPFGIVPLEAMACAVPVVASAVGGLLDTVVDGVTGAHVPPRRPDRLAAVVERLLANSTSRSALGAAGRQRAEHRYRWSAVAAATAAAYRRTTGGREQPQGLSGRPAGNRGEPVVL